MKVIDILDRIANGEEVPKRIMYRGVEWVYNDRQYYRVDGEHLRNIWSGYNFNILDDEVEIIEEDKKIEKLEIVHNGSANAYALLNEYGTKCALTKHSKVMCDKINEIIDKLNEGE